MPMITMDRAAFWEFKARSAELDLEAARLKAAIVAVGLRKNALIETLTAAHGLDPHRPFTLEDSDFTVRQE